MTFFCRVKPKTFFPVVLVFLVSTLKFVTSMVVGWKSRTLACASWQGSRSFHFTTGWVSRLCLMSTGSTIYAVGELSSEFTLIRWCSSYVNVDIYSFRVSKFALILSSIISGKTPSISSSILSQSHVSGATAVFSAFTDIFRCKVWL